MKKKAIAKWHNNGVREVQQDCIVTDWLKCVQWVHLHQPFTESVEFQKEREREGKAHNPAIEPFLLKRCTDMSTIPVFLRP